MMHSLRLLLSLGAPLALLTAQADFDPARTYKAGEKDTYALAMKMATGAYDVSITGRLTYTTKKVYDNGDAEIESLSSDITINAMGQESKQPSSEPRTGRYSKYGAPVNVELDRTKRQPVFMGFLTYRPGVPMKIGQSVKVQESLKDDLETKVSGNAKLESVTDGIAKLTSSLDISQKSLKKPMHIDAVSYIEVQTSKLNRAESKLTNIDEKEVPGIPGVNSITVVIERERSAR